MPGSNPSRRVSVLHRIGYCLLPALLGAGAALMLLLGAGGPAPLAYAGTLTFPGACGATIQQCIDGANPGDTILISAGDYSESLTLSKAVSLTGALSSTTILHALANTRVLTVTGAAVDSSVVISGLTFTGGAVTSTASCPESCGGGILISNNAQPRLDHISIIGNVASSSGGGLYAASGSPLVLQQVSVIHNALVPGPLSSIRLGGGVYASDSLSAEDSLFQANATSDTGGGLYVLKTLILTDTQFLSNTAGGGGGMAASGPTVVQGGLFQNNSSGLGGGFIAGGSLTMRDSSIISNTGWVAAGALFEGAPTDVVTLWGGLFQGNAATNNGGGFYSEDKLNVIATQFRGNTAVGIGGAGVLAGASSVQNALFEGNSAGVNGGALFVSAGPARIVNTLFSGNAAVGDGEALYLTANTTILFTTISSPTLASGVAVGVGSGTAGITDTIISSYTTGISLTGASALENYNLFFGVPVTTMGGVVHGGHSHTGDPAFRAPAAGDYHLTAASAAINAGTNAGVTTDFEGDPRPLGGFDIGYDEYVPFKLYLPLVMR